MKITETTGDQGGRSFFSPVPSCKITQRLKNVLLFSGQPVDHQRLVAAPQRVVEMVDPLEEGTSSTKTLVERLEEAPQKILSYVSDNTKAYVAHVLALVTSYWPQAKLAPLASGAAVDCSEDDFLRYREESEPLASDIIKSLE